MFTTFLEKLSGFFDKHWLLRYFFPSLAFWAAGLAAYGAAKGITEPVDLWHRQPTEVQVILLAGTLLWVTLFAYLLANFSTALVRLFEGYWQHWPLTLLRRPRQEYYQNRFLYLQAKLRQSSKISDPRERQWLEREWLLLFPQGRDREKAVMPTRLGNIIKAAETYPLERYGADAVILWPRLVPYLPAEFAEALNGAQTAMEVMLVMSALSFAFSAVSCTLLAALTLDTGLFAACATGFLLAWICYRNSLHGALGYAELIKAAFDLHRGKLLDDLGLEKPTNPEEERKIWKDVSEWFFRNTPFLTARFKGTPAPQPDAPQPEPQPWLGKVVGKLFALVLAVLLPKPKSPAAPGPASTASPARQQPPAPPASTRPPYDVFPFAYFGTLLLLCLAVAMTLLHYARQPVHRVALARDVPAYRLLRAGDLEMEKTARSEAPDDGFRDPTTVAGRAYLVQPLAKGTVLTKSGIRTVEDPLLLDGRVAFGISATPAMALGGALKPGDVVGLAIAPAKDALPWDPACDPRSLRRLLALDVKPQKDGSSYVVVLAVPPACQAALAGAAGRISLARAL